MEAAQGVLRLTLSPPLSTPSAAWCCLVSGYVGVTFHGVVVAVVVLVVLISLFFHYHYYHHCLTLRQVF